MNKSRKFLSMVLAALLTLTFLSGVAQATVPAAKDGVVIATAQEPTHFFNQDEQYLTSQAKDGPVLMQLYDTLYWMGEDGSCQPSLATSYEVSDDGMEYVFELRDDVYFHNGEKMTAEDVAFTYNLCVEKNAQLTKNLLMNFKEAQVVDEVIRINALIDIVERTVAHEAELHVAGCPEKAAVSGGHRRDGAGSASGMLSYQRNISCLFEYARNEIAAREAHL